MATVEATEEDSFFTREDKQRLIARLARVEGQLRGIQKMVRNSEDCEKIAQQLAAARGALNKAFSDLLACAFETKLGTFRELDPNAKEKVTELAALVSKYA